MSVIQKIMESSETDTDVLRRLDSEGDNFTAVREVDFTFICPDMNKAEVVAGFLGDYQFGRSEIINEQDQWEVLVQIDMPVTQNVLLSISAFMTCIAELYGVEYDGWGCVAQNDT